jgi:hypothetical protein
LILAVDVVFDSQDEPKDRHVLAVAVVSGAQTIVTINLKDFPTNAISQWNVEVQSPDVFLIHQYHLDPAMVFSVLREQAAKQGGWERLITIVCLTDTLEQHFETDSSTSARCGLRQG